MKFPCDCISSTPECDEAWARVAKEGMFKNGTKEELLNLVHARPQTIAQLADATNFTRPTIHRHVMELLENGLIREIEPEDKDWSVERYYQPNFPIVSGKDQDLFSEAIASLAGAFARDFRERRDALRLQYASSDAASAGWDFNEIAYYIWHAAQRMARKSIEAEGSLDPSVRRGRRDFPFWASE